mgnify:CR=1 FL=1
MDSVVFEEVKKNSGDATKDRDIVGEKVTKERTIFRKSGLEKSTKKNALIISFWISTRETPLLYIYIETRPTLLKHLHAHHHHHRRRHVVENTTTTNNNDDEKETKNARRVPTLHADEPAVGSVPHRAIPFHRIFLSRRENDREPICRRAGHERVRQERRNDRE